MTTPEQLAKWRKEANKSFDSDRFKVDGLSTYGGFVEGFLRAKQENEQAMKRLQEALEVVETRFELTPSDRAFLKSLGLQKELIK